MARMAFYPLDDFPALRALAGAWETMRDEVAALRAPVMDVDRARKAHHQVVAEVVQRVRGGEPFGWVKGWGAAGGNSNWTQYGLLIGDQPISFAAAAAPRTLAILAALSGIKVAAFVRLAPHSFLSTHTHPELKAEGLLQMHVALTAPASRNYCYLSVAGQFRKHVPGRAFVFDGSLDHFAVNASDGERTILYLEFSQAAQHRPDAARLNQPTAVA